MTECTFGIWKRRFPCVKNGLRNDLDFAKKTIVATAVLHNISILWADGLPPGEERPVEQEVPEHPEDQFIIEDETGTEAVRARGQALRDMLTENMPENQSPPVNMTCNNIFWTIEGHKKMFSPHVLVRINAAKCSNNCDPQFNRSSLTNTVTTGTSLFDTYAINMK